MFWKDTSRFIYAPTTEQGKSEGFDSCDRSSNLTQIGFKSSIFQPVWPWNLMDDPKKQLGTSSMLLQAFCIIRSHWWIQTGVTVGKHLIWVKIDDFFSRVTLTFDGWPSKTIGHLFYAISSFVQHFVAIDEFKLELQSGNAQSGSKSMIFEPCDLEIWRMTLKNNRAPLLCYVILCVSFHSHWWIQTGVTVRKRPILVKFDTF